MVRHLSIEGCVDITVAKEKQSYITSGLSLEVRMYRNRAKCKLKLSLIGDQSVISEVSQNRV